MTTNEEFHKDVDAILRKRLAQFRHLTSIVGRNSRRGDLQWYLHSRDRSRVKMFQNTSEQSETYVIRTIPYGKDGEINEDVRANPDTLSESDTMWHNADDGHQEEIKAMSLTMAHAFKLLSKTENKVFQLLRRGKGSTEIAEMLNLKQGSVSTLIQRIQRKMRKVLNAKEGAL